MQQLKQRLPWLLGPAPPGESLGQPRNIVLGLPLALPQVGWAWTTSPGRRPNQMPQPPQPVPLDVEEWPLSDDPLSKWGHTDALRRKLIWQCRSFGHDPKLFTLDKGRNVDWPVDLYRYRPAQRTHHFKQRTNPSINLLLSFSFSCEQDWEIVNSFTRGTTLSPARRRLSTLFQTQGHFFMFKH